MKHIETVHTTHTAAQDHRDEAVELARYLFTRLATAGSK
jgi:hypothetical protein